MVKWFNSREAVRLGAALADHFADNATSIADRKDLLERTHGAVLVELLQRADLEVGSLSLNFFKRAKFANSFKWRLLEKGIDRQVADSVTERLLMHLSLNPTNTASSSMVAEGPQNQASTGGVKQLLARGNRELASGAYAQAIDSYEELLALEPHHGDALNNLGAALCSVGRYGEAAKCFRRAMRVEPNSPEAHNNLGNVLRWRGQMEESEAFLRQAVRINPKYLDARTNLGSVLAFLGRLREADRQFKKVLKAAPHNAQALYGLGHLAAIEGRFDEAETMFGRALKANSRMSSALSGMASTRKMTVEDGAWLSRAEELVASGIPPMEEAELRFAIGKYSDDVRDFARAFRNYERANEMLKRVADPYDRGAHARFVDEMVLAYPKEEVSATQPGSSSSTKPILVLGMMRSGTSLAEQMIASHGSVRGAGELSFWSDAMEAHGDAIRQHKLTEATRSKLAGDYLRALESRCPDGAHVVDKAPVNSDNVGLIHSVFPNARIVYMQRDPIDTCLSCYFQKLSPALNFSMDLSDLAHYYREHRRLVEHWRAVLPAGSMLDVPYEELVADQEKWTRRILEFLGLDWDDRCLEFHKTDRPVVTSSYWQVRQKIYSNSVARWKNYQKFIRPLLDLGK